MKRLRIGVASLLVFLCLIGTASAEWWDTTTPPRSRAGVQMPGTWWEWVKGGSRLYGTNPFLVAAVMDVEANGWRAGRLGHSRYFGPCGFNSRCSIPSDVLLRPEVQIRWACRILAGSPQRRLRRYNETWWKDNYIRDVLGLAKRMERDAANKLK